MCPSNKWKSEDEEYSREYVRSIFDREHETCLDIAKTLRMTTQGEVIFSVNGNIESLVSFAVLGASLGILQTKTDVMSTGRAIKIQAYCKDFIEIDWGLSTELTDKMHRILDTYVATAAEASGLETAIVDITELILWSCLDERSIKMLLMTDNVTINPFVSQILSDVLIIIITGHLMFWKGK